MDERPLRVTCYPWLSYSPLHLAHELDLFADHGIAVDLRGHEQGWNDLIQALPSRETDVILGNMWFALRRQGPRLVAVAACAQRCRFVIVGRRDDVRESFSWDDLARKSMAIASSIPTPWFALRQAMARSVLSLDDARVVSGYSTLEALEDVRSGEVDLALVDVDNAQHEGVVEVAALADYLPAIPWSVFCTLESTLAEQPERILSFRAAIDDALAWLRTHAVEEWVDVLGPRFSQLDRTSMARALHRYLELDIWPDGAGIDPDATRQWQSSLLRWGGVTELCEISEIIPLDVVKQPATR
ncbi:MAG TPA: ABC transporter substrate-binding protein [Acidimicrobiales bacterium]|jgi:ABC-type nitrate/sulfonate/bicarbonate transport system substrate-binding protein|nr:ABC transporter substrate-binding protein [Acidimicrobiales bacterium]